MEWVGTLMATVVVVLLLLPLAVAVGGMLIMAALGPLLPLSPMVSCTSFDCPFSRRRVKAEFLIWPGEERPADVLSCSAFADPQRIRCKKGCLPLAVTGSVSEALVPRYSLVAGGVAYRGTLARAA